jgi:hypothetical protein
MKRWLPVHRGYPDRRHCEAVSGEVLKVTSKNRGIEAGSAWIPRFFVTIECSPLSHPLDMD